MLGMREEHDATTIMAAPSRKQSRMLGETGAMLKQRISTMAAMGRTA